MLATAPGSLLIIRENRGRRHPHRNIYLLRRPTVSSLRDIMRHSRNCDTRESGHSHNLPESVDSVASYVSNEVSPQTKAESPKLDSSATEVRK